MSEERYRSAVDWCTQAAGAGDEGWNRRFIEALAANGLKLVPADQDRMITHEIMAPQPYETGEPRWSDSWIVEA